MICDSSEITGSCRETNLFEWSSQNGQESFLGQVIRKCAVAAQRAQVPPHARLVLRDQLLEFQWSITGRGYFRIDAGQDGSNLGSSFANSNLLFRSSLTRRVSQSIKTSAICSSRTPSANG